MPNFFVDKAGQEWSLEITPDLAESLVALGTDFRTADGAWRTLERWSRMDTAEYYATLAKTAHAICLGQCHERGMSARDFALCLPESADDIFEPLSAAVFVHTSDGRPMLKIYNPNETDVNG